MAPTGAVIATLLAAAPTTGCSGEESRRLEPTTFAMTDDTAPFYSDGELTLYETRSEVNLPIRRPSASEQAQLGTAIPPFDHTPWITASDVRVQVTWTLANMDPEPHAVKVLVNPWTEFGRYVPGVQMDGDDAIPNLAGIEDLYQVPGLESEGSSRVEHVFTYADMKELAIDFATVINIIDTVMPPPSDAGMDDPRVSYVNHAFAVENRHGSSPLTDQYIPKKIPGLVGFEIALRTEEPANLALEYSVELIDETEDRLMEDGSHDPTFQAPGTEISPPGG